MATGRARGEMENRIKEQRARATVRVSVRRVCVSMALTAPDWKADTPAFGEPSYIHYGSQRLLGSTAPRLHGAK
jgi:hypothetical protein